MKTNRTLIKLAIICIALTDVGVGATTPALATIGAAFPGFSVSLIQMIASIPALFVGLIPTLLYAPLVRFIRKRSILYIGCVLFLVGGIAPAWINSSIYHILIFRAFLGIGIGLLTPMGIDLIYDFFEGHEQRTMLGWSSACIGFSGILFQTLGGFLCQISWQYTFYAYFVAAVFFAIAIAFLPEPNKRIETVAEGAPKYKHKIPSATYLYVILLFLNGVFFFIPITNAAYVLIGEGMAQPGQIGLMFSVMTLAAVIIGIVFGQLFKVFKFHILTISFVCGAIGLFLASYTQSVTVYTIALFLNGFTLGGTTSAVWVKFGTIVPAAMLSLAIGLGVSAFNLGQFFQPIIFNFFTVPGRQPFMIGWIGFVVLAVVSIILEKAFPSKIIAESTAQLPA
ncbi:MFS transporter [Desulfosporosinus burensis]